MRNIANYDVTAACGYVGCPLNGFKTPLAPLSWTRDIKERKGSGTRE